MESNFDSPRQREVTASPATRGVWVVGILAAIVAVFLSTAAVHGFVGLGLCALPVWIALAAASGSLRLSAAVGAIAGFAIGAIRTSIVGWPLFQAADVPLLAGFLTAVWVGALHAVATVGLVATHRRGRLLQVLGGPIYLTVLEAALCSPSLFPLPYLSVAHIAADTAVVRVVAVVGPFGVVFAIVLLATVGFYSRTTCPTLFRLIFSLGCVLCLWSLCSLLPVRRPEVGPTLNITAVASPKHLSLVAADSDLVVLPESAVVVGSGEEELADPHSISPADLAEWADTFDARPAVIAGGIIELRGEGQTYRNSTYVRPFGGPAAWSDKRIPVPGREANPFERVPVLGEVAAYAVVSDGQFFGDTPGRGTIELLGVPTTTAVCFEHLMPVPWEAWGVTANDSVGLAVSVGRVEELGSGVEAERRMSQRARRLHAVVLSAPVVAVTDCWAELAMPDGRVETVRFTTERPAWQFRVSTSRANVVGWAVLAANAAPSFILTTGVILTVVLLLPCLPKFRQGSRIRCEVVQR